MRPALAVLNPRAGLAARRALSALERSPHWKDVPVHVTTRAGEAGEVAAQAAAAGVKLVLSLGGDGTANEVASGLLGTETALGLVPVGSGNGLARTLGIPLDPDRALPLLAGGLVRRMDVGTANGRPFLNVSGAGFDAEVGADFHDHGKRGGRRGVLTYVRLSLSRTWSYRAESWVLDAGAERFEGRALVVACMNGQQYGGGAVMAPGARLDDGLLDIVVIEDAPQFEVVWNATRLFLGGIEKFRRYRRFPAAAATLRATGPFLHHRDGEPEPPQEAVEFGLRPGALWILVPRATAEAAPGPFGPSER
jgi:YegS/Rv2252/BmrU family lipid kinase